MAIKNIVLLINNLNKGGAERVVALLANKLSQHEGVHLHLVQIESGVEYQLPKNIEKITLSKSINKGSIIKLIEIPILAWRLSRYLKKNRVDTVVSFLYRSNYINILSNIFSFKRKVVIGIRSTTSRYINSGISGKINLWLIKLLFNKADLIMSNSFGVDSDLKELMNIKTETAVWNNPIDIEYIKEKVGDSKGAVFQFDLHKKYIISIGRLIPLKRNKDLIFAFKSVLANFPRLELIFVGNGECKKELEKNAKDFGVSDKVHLIGQVDNPFYLLKKSDIFILNSETEGFPNVLIEAMACGLPVISSNCKSGPDEILNNEEFGRLYEVGDIEALAGCIEDTLLLDNSKLKNIRNKNIERANDFDINKSINKFIEVL